ncbi:(deoxy)nucleoside triphosphate pyrophosphohydrolase [Porphyrobacter sp. AAP60]|uniref:(deoxy)nucleoside triphosphate pyrophosphohydrolase n=1 Tax=Porphyrobacter sp. AAP60 TaxID=1523423 RepID=UPI0006B9BB37|nr:(deoxy)nucleoside triphosphate pyrophosphohydrolase [Porphyrobacter sp. AAP60]KPF65021.1 DNA mismatch repair protein MutT [Porphyrobacter sp. AAP60]
MTTGWITVVAGALYRADGRWLMHRRPPEKHHGGLWEFPGGKVEPFETPIQSLKRELAEEIGITIDFFDCHPAGFAQSAANNDERAIVLLLYTISHWQGVPEALEGGEVCWFTPEEVLALSKPPLDVALARQLFRNNVSAANGPCQD